MKLNDVVNFCSPLIKTTFNVKASFDPEAGGIKPRKIMAVKPPAK